MITRNITDITRKELEADLSEHGEYRIVTTVRHTGTHSIKEQFPGFKHWHCNPTVWELIRKNPGANVITTYRDPLRTAASWYNRTQLPLGIGRYKRPQSQGMIFSWKEAWEYYGKVIEVIPKDHIYRMEDLQYKLYTHPDSVGAHALLDAGDLDGYYNLVDKDLIDYAFKQIHSLGASYVKRKSPGTLQKPSCER